MPILQLQLLAFTPSQGDLALTAQVFLAGLLAAMSVLGILGFGRLRERAFFQTSLFGIGSILAWAAFSGLGSSLLGDSHPHLLLTAGLLLMALTFAALGRIPFGRLIVPRGNQGLRRMEHGMTLAALLAALLILLPWNASHLASAALLGTLLPLLTVLSLIRATHQSEHLRAQVETQNEELALRMQELEAARQAAESANREIQRALDQLEEAASTDRLTGAWNRRHFEEVVPSEMALAKRHGSPLSLIMFDLDHFKRVNDTFGHGTGDMVLVTTAQTIREQLRTSDALIRWGGEEFLVMLPATGSEGALALAEKLRSAVAGVAYPEVGNVTVSLGTAAYAGSETLPAWIERADAALYKAKTGGRNKVVEAPVPPESMAPPSKAILQVVWEDTYASGHPLIDVQHQGLFRMASQLLAGLTEGQPTAEIALRLQKLIAHAAQHFMDEEGLLRTAHYPDLSHHSAIHAQLLSRATDLHQQVADGHLDFGVLVGFLAKDLVMGHLLTEDRNYFSALVAKG